MDGTTNRQGEICEHESRDRLLPDTSVTLKANCERMQKSDKAGSDEPRGRECTKAKNECRSALVNTLVQKEAQPDDTTASRGSAQQGKHDERMKKDVKKLTAKVHHGIDSPSVSDIREADGKHRKERSRSRTPRKLKKSERKRGSSESTSETNGYGNEGQPNASRERSEHDSQQSGQDVKSTRKRSLGKGKSKEKEKKKGKLKQKDKDRKNNKEKGSVK